MKIVIIEKDPYDKKMVSLHFTKLGHEVVVVESIADIKTTFDAVCASIRTLVKDRHEYIHDTFDMAKLVEELKTLNIGTVSLALYSYLPNRTHSVIDALKDEGLSATFIDPSSWDDFEKFGKALKLNPVDQPVMKIS